MIGLLGKKVGMTRVFNEEGNQIPVTLLQVGPCVVTRLRLKEKEGYTAVQLGFGEKKESRFTKSLLGQFKKTGLAPKRWVREIRTEETEGLQVGTELKVDNFEVGDFVDVEGESIGKGFQGVVKRHHFRGGAKSHGSMFGRVAGSIGASSFPSRVVKGMRMPGQMGNRQTTVQNLKVIQVDLENHLLAVSGAVPGAEECLVIVRSALKRGKAKKWKTQKTEEAKPQQPAEAKTE